MKKRAAFWLRIAVSGALLALIVLYLDSIGEVGRLLAGAAPHYLALAFLVMTLDRVLMGYKWVMLLRARGLRLPLLQSIKIYCTSMLWGQFLPATVGADAIRGYLTTREGIDGYETFASIAVERLVGFVAALVFALASFMILRGLGAADERLDFIWIGGAALTALAAVTLALSFSERLFGRLVLLLPPRVRDARIVGKLRQFHGAYSAYRTERGVVAAFFVLTLIEQSFVVLATWVTALALHLDVGLLFIAGALPLAMLVSRLPVSLDGIGVFEGAMVLLLGLAGISAAQAVALSLAGRVIQTVVWLPWWLAYAAQRGLVPPKRAPTETSLP